MPISSCRAARPRCRLIAVHIPTAKLLACPAARRGALRQPASASAEALGRGRRAPARVGGRRSATICTAGSAPISRSISRAAGRLAASDDLAQPSDLAAADLGRGSPGGRRRLVALDARARSGDVLHHRRRADRHALCRPDQLRPCHPAPQPPLEPGGWAGLWIPAATVAGAVLLAGATGSSPSATSDRPCDPAPRRPDRRAQRGTLTHAELAEIELVRLPAVWRPYETARLAFRDSWCKQEALPSEIWTARRCRAARSPTGSRRCAPTGAPAPARGRLRRPLLPASMPSSPRPGRPSAPRSGTISVMEPRRQRPAAPGGATLVGLSLAARLGRGRPARRRDGGRRSARRWLERALLRGADLRQGTLTGADFKGRTCAMPGSTGRCWPIPTCAMRRSAMPGSTAPICSMPASMPPT